MHSSLVVILLGKAVKIDNNWLLRSHDHTTPTQLTSLHVRMPITLYKDGDKIPEITNTRYQTWQIRTKLN